MPPQLLFDLSAIDLDGLLFDQEAVRSINAQRGHMEQLNGIIWADKQTECILGFKDIGTDEFWVDGHIPGRPLFPGVLMIECAAQVASFYSKQFVGWGGFIGFGGVEEVKFRTPVLPGQRLLVLSRKIWQRHRRLCCETQGVVGGNLAFEAKIIGMQM